MARRVIDVARVHAAIAGPDPEDPTSSPQPPPDVLGRIGDSIDGVRILMPASFFEPLADPAMGAAVRRAAEVLAGLGAVVEGGDLPGAADAQRHLMPIIYADACAYHRERLEEAPERFGRDVRRRLQPGLELRAIDYAASLRWIESWRHQVEQLFATRWDAVLTPTLPCTAPLADPDADVIEVSARLGQLTWTWPAARVPALSVPCGFHEGLPIGMQLAGPRWSEPLLLRIGHAYQLATEWHHRRPPPLQA